MELLVARNLNVERSGRTLVGSLDLTLRAGTRLGLVGPNGAGKSSLLRVLAGSERPNGGYLRRAPGVRLGYLEQNPRWDPRQSAWSAARAGLERVTLLELELRDQEQQLARGTGSMERYCEIQDAFERSGGYGAEPALREALADVGLLEHRLSLPLNELSGGEVARLGIIRALAEDPDVLLLDEPSNHLDLPALQWLGRRLQRRHGALVLVSHDRALLDEVCTDTGELRDGQLTITRGGVSRLREQQGLRRRGDERRERERRKEVERLERTAAELRVWGTAKAQRRRKRLERQREDRRQESPGHAGRAAAPKLITREASGVLLEARSLSKSYGGRKVIDRADLRLRAGDKVAILGPNGSGKSTLLRLLAGEVASDDPRSEFHWHRDSKLFYSDQQERGLVSEKALLDQLTDLVSSERAHMLLALCGLDESKRLLPPDSLSGGERARAGLARLLAAEANIVLLDEPTNDLDLSAIENLQQGLEGSEAAVVMATHDRQLARLAERVWAVEEGELIEYRGGFEGYLAGRRRLEPELSDSFPGSARLWQPGEIGDVSLASSAVAAADRSGDWSAEVEAAGAELERLELERIGIEARLDDPLLLSARDKLRLEQRLTLVIDDLSAHYDSLLSAPLPTLALKESGLLVSAARSGAGLNYSCPAPAELRLLVADGIGHLTLREQHGVSLLPWARGALLDAATRLAFYTVAPLAVQHYSPHELHSRLLQPGSDGWWSLPRRTFERLEGWCSEAPPTIHGERR